MSRRSIGSLALFFILLPVLLRAQERAALSQTVGYEFGVPLFVSRSTDIVNYFGSDGFGAAYNHSYRFGAELARPDLFDRRIGLALRLDLAASLGRFRSFPFTTVDLPAERIFQIDVSALTLASEIRVALEPIDGWLVGLGGWSSYRLLDQIIENEVIVDPVATFPDDSRSREIARGDSLATSRSRYGLVASVGTTLAINSLLALRPEIIARFDLAEAGLGLRAFSFGVGLAFPLGTEGARESAPKEEAPPPIASDAGGNSAQAPLPPTTVAPSDTAGRAQRPTLSAAIDLFALDDAEARTQLATVRPRLVHRLLSMSIPFVLYFEPGSSTIPARYHRLARAAANPSDVDSALVRTYEGAYYAMLDLIGLRLRQDARSGCLLRPVGVAGEPRRLAGERVDSIRRYLHEIWGIEEERIRSGSVGPVNVGMPGIAIVLGVGRDEATAIDQKIFYDDLLQEYEAPRLDMEPTIDAEVGLRRWSVLVRQGDSVIARTGSDGASQAPLVIPVVTGRLMPSPVIAEIEAEDSAGTVSAARDTLPIVVDRALPLRVGDLSVSRLAELPLREEWVVSTSGGVAYRGTAVVGDAIDALVERAAAAERVKVIGHDARDVAARLMTALERKGLRSIAVEVIDRPALVATYPEVPESHLLSHVVRLVLER